MLILPLATLAKSGDFTINAAQDTPFYFERRKIAVTVMVVRMACYRKQRGLSLLEPAGPEDLDFTLSYSEAISAV